MAPAFHCWRNVVFWGLLPIAAVQGLLLRRRALRLLPPPGETQGSCGRGEPLHMLALGDSIIAGIGAAEQEQTLPRQFARALSVELNRRVSWQAAGRNGAKLADLLAQVHELGSATQADVILLSIGVNDVTGLRSTRTWRKQLHRLTAALRSKWPQALVVFVGLPPMGQFPLPPQPLRFSLGLRAARLDRIARNLLTDEPGMMHIATHIDPVQHSFCADGFHPAPESYRIWAQELVRLITSGPWSVPLRVPPGHRIDDGQQRHPLV